jgi:hypothetical protein
MHYMGGICDKIARWEAVAGKVHNTLRETVIPYKNDIMRTDPGLIPVKTLV